MNIFPSYWPLHLKIVWFYWNLWVFMTRFLPSHTCNSYHEARGQTVSWRWAEVSLSRWSSVFTIRTAPFLGQKRVWSQSQDVQCHPAAAAEGSVISCVSTRQIKLWLQDVQGLTYRSPLLFLFLIFILFPEVFLRGNISSVSFFWPCMMVWI